VQAPHWNALAIEDDEVLDLALVHELCDASLVLVVETVLDIRPHRFAHGGARRIGVPLCDAAVNILGGNRAQQHRRIADGKLGPVAIKHGLGGLCKSRCRRENGPRRAHDLPHEAPG
jgi:hypothetical protein